MARPAHDARLRPPVGAASSPLTSSEAIVDRLATTASAVRRVLAAPYAEIGSTGFVGNVQVRAQSGMFLTGMG